MTDQELKPCPFCGGAASLKKTSNSIYPFRAVCSICDASNNGSVFECDSYNVKSWNTRHQSPQQINAIKAEGLRELLVNHDKRTFFGTDCVMVSDLLKMLDRLEGES